MKLSTDRIVSITAMVIGIGSLFVTTYQTHLMREAQSASVLPYLMIGLDSNDVGAFLMLRNQGVGPAIVRDVRVLGKGGDFTGDPFDFYTAARPGVDTSVIDVHKIMPGRLIRDGESLRMIGIETSVGGPERRGKILVDLLQLFHVAEVPKAWYAGVGLTDPQGAVVEITYESVFGDRWRIRSDRLVPEALN